MRLIEVGLVLATLCVVVVVGSWVMARAATVAEAEHGLDSQNAERQRAVAVRVRYWGVRALLVSVWVVAVGFILEVIRTA